ncbi:DNRLRE domain-containing protein [Paenibacillus sp. YN15]|uniref:CBM96 family carbohydrate-binding protein n=1 Tax=Paenibacillus sp. YN15 TaxID=1742774 RepID=UPI000DCF2F13|nr:DNRLRE domain-containing protein [Paenibacillus sp. YN15]RAU93853.1 hypothetical protein DQG13_24910 [Paenibacillus sp. YN15]
MLTVLLAALLAVPAVPWLPGERNRTVAMAAGGGNIFQLAPTDDAYVRGGHANADTAFGTEESIIIKNVNADIVSTRQGLLKFDLSAVQGPVRSAKLKVYGKIDSDPDPKYPPHDLFFYGLENDSWTEKGATWNKRPDMDHFIGSSLPDKTWKWLEIDATAFVNKQLLQDGKASFGVVQKTANGVVARINSKESSANQPYLEIETGSAGEGVPEWPQDARLELAQRAGEEPALQWTPAEYAGDYRIYRDGALLGTSGGGTSFTLAGLEPGQKHTFRVEAGNALGQWNSAGPYVTAIIPPAGSGVIAPAADTFVQGGSSATKNYGSSPVLAIKNVNSDLNVTRQGLLKFDLSGYAGAVGSAKLRIYAASIDADAANLLFYGLENDGWQENAVVWSNKPELEHTLGKAALNRIWKWVEIDVTSFIREQAAKDRTAGFAIVQQETMGNVINMTSRENSLFRPYLTIAEEKADPLAPVWPDQARVAADGMTETGLALSWFPAADPGGVTAYRIYRNGEIMGTVDGSTLAYQAEGLEPGQRYTFRVEAGNAAGRWTLDGPYATVLVPKTSLVSEVMGNVFTAGEPIRMKVATTRPLVEWRVRDWRGSLQQEGTAYSHNGEVQLNVPFSKLGQFILEAAVKSEYGEDIELKTSFAVVPGPQDQAKLAGSPFGVAAHLHRYAYGWTPDLLPLMHYAGIHTVRGGNEWPLENPRGVYNFGTPDGYMYKVADSGMEFMLVTGYNNPLYDNNSTPYTEDGRQGFANFAKAYADQYPGMIHSMEVYNEFNGGFGDRGTGPADSKPEYYFSLLKKTYETVKAAHPDLPVAGMVTAGTPLAWMEEVFKLGGLDYLDVISIHPYQYPNSPEKLLKDIQGLKALVRKYNNGQLKPIWISEFGWPTFIGARGVTESVQADYLLQAHVLALSEGIEKIIWYNFMDDGIVKDLNEDNFGLVHNVLSEWGAYTPKPAYAVYAAMTRELSQAEFKADETADGVSSYLFDAAGTPLRVVWSNTPLQAAILADGPVEIMDAMGNSALYTPYEGKIYATLTGEPIYIKGAVEGVEPDSSITITAGNAFAGQPVPMSVGFANSDAEEFQAELRVDGQTYPIQAAAGETVSVPVAAGGLSNPGRRVVEGYLYRDQQRIGLLRSMAQVQEAYEVSLHPTYAAGEKGEQVLKLKVRNLDEQTPLTVEKAQWKVGSQSGEEIWSARIQPGERGSFSIPLAAVPEGTDQAVSVSLSLGSAGKYVYEGKLQFNPVLKGTVAVDGSVDEWVGSSRPAIDLSKGTVKITGYQGAGDLSGQAWMHHDQQYLYVTAQITDNKHSAAFAGADIWRNDSIQFGIASGLPGASADWYEYGISLTDAGPQLYRWTAPAGKKAGPVESGQVRIARSEEEKHTVYELALPWEELEPVRAQKDGVISFSLLVNDNDGDGRRGWIEWGSGIGEGKQPSKFRTMQWIDDSYLPAVRITGVQNGAVYNDRAVPVVRAEDEDGDLAEVHILLDGAPWDSGIAVTGKGSHVLAAEARDQAGHTAKASAAFTILHSTALGLENKAVKLGEAIVLQAALRDLGDRPVAGQPVAFNISGQSGTALTDEAGMASWTVPEGALPEAGIYPWQAMYAGSDTDYYRGSSGRRSLHVYEGAAVPPVALSGRYATRSGEAVNGTLRAEAAAGSSLSFWITANGSKGTATITDAVYGQFIYEPRPGETGMDEFQFAVSDGTAQSAPATIAIEIREEEPVLRQLEFGQSGYTLYPGDTLQTVVQAVYEHGARVDATSRSSFSSGNPAVAEMNAAGVIQARSAGTTVIAATYGGLRAEATVTVKERWYSTGGAPSEAISATGRLLVPSGIPGELSLNSEAAISIPAGAMNASVLYTIEKLENRQDYPAGDGLILMSGMYDIQKDVPGDFAKPVLVRIRLASGMPGAGRQPALYYYDNQTGKWVKIGGTLQDGFVGAQVDHFTVFAVFAEAPGQEKPVKTEPPLMGFADISGHWGEAAIKRAVQYKLVDGYDGGLFLPDRSLTREELAVMLWRAAGQQAAAAGGAAFTDEDRISPWALEAVRHAAARGWIEGYEDGSLRPQALVTRAEMAVLLMRMCQDGPWTLAATGFSDDGNIPQWAKSFIAHAVEAGYLEGRGENRFEPLAPVTRAEMAAVLVRVKEKD